MKATGNIVRGTREREMRRQIRLVEEREREGNPQALILV